MEKWLEKINWAELLLHAGIWAGKFLLIIILFLIVRSIGRSVINQMFSRAATHRKMPSGRVITLQKLVINMFSYVLIFVFAGIVFKQFGLEIGTLIAGAGVVGLAVGFGAQGLVSDVVTGFFILLEKQMDVGDYVTIGGVDGIIEEVGLRTTHIRSFDGTLNFMPNREISTLANHSRGNMRALVDIGIAYEEDIDTAIQVLQEACDKVKANNENIMEGPSVLGVQTLGASDVVIRIISKTKNGEQWAVERQLRQALKEALDANNIEIPYPHQVEVRKIEK
ncbi:mechanosensitive ion channel family protein [Fictibacillus barbaricus]|uniref:Small conductance mechanosensitive channel n=1 Tax=Fictibacillus barbaricus TaxID=182136 RepID=A0ABU1TX54_9BACL|nr:mechanosensitive ion channel family protein [Fictibacillus barbaricus]MDR7071781.1 small conductance mechanosensitive channel [Fictibacillus barbaricus]